MACLLHCAKWIRSLVCGATGVARPAEAIMQMVPLRTDSLSDLARKVEVRLGEISSSLEVGRPLSRPTLAPRFPTPAFILRAGPAVVA